MTLQVKNGCYSSDELPFRKTFSKYYVTNVCFF